MHSKSDNTEIMIYDREDKFIQDLFESLLNRNHIESETPMRGSDFTFDYDNLLRCKCHQINLKQSGSYADSPDLIKNKKQT